MKRKETKISVFRMFVEVVGYLLLMHSGPIASLGLRHHVKRVLNKLAKHVSIINRLRHFTSCSVVIRYYKTYMKPIIQYGLLIYGCTRKSVLNDIFLDQKKILRITYFKNRRYPSDDCSKEAKL